MRSGYFFCAVLIAVSCSDFDDTQLNGVNGSLSDIKDDITVVEGHLHFKNEDALEMFLYCVSDETVDHLSNETYYIPGFTSLASMRHELVTKGINDEDMTKEEFEIFCAEELLVDPVLAHVMDTSLVIGVGDKTYKVTDKGTFVMNSEMPMWFMNEMVDKFNPVVLELIGEDHSMVLTENMSFVNTFRDSGEELFEEVLDEVETRVYAPGVSFHSSYNVKTYSWKNNSVFEKFMDQILGKAVAETKEIDSKHRVEVSLFNVDYKFYKSSGMTVKLQEKRKFLGIPYWTAIEAKEMAVGFNHMAGEYRLVGSQPYSMFADKGFLKFSSFNIAIDDAIKPMLAKYISSVPFIKNWTSSLAFCIPKVVTEMTGQSQLQIANSLYDASAAGLCGGLKSGLRSIYDAEDRKTVKIAESDPKMAFMVWGKSSSKFIREKPVITGLKKYNSKMSSKTVRFDISFGAHISLSSGFNVKPMAISEYKIQDIDTFGAVKYEDKWHGVRFVGSSKIW